jgi:hypothetical protein
MQRLSRAALSSLGSALLAVTFTATLSAQTTAAYSVFGDNCGPSCAALNDTRGTLRTGTLPNEYAFGHRFTQPAVVLGFQLYTHAPTAPANGVITMTCSVYRESTTPNAPAVTAVATGTMSVGNTIDFYTVWLDQPVVLMANEAIWIAQHESTLVLGASLTAGTSPALPTYWRRPAGGGTAWATTGTLLYPAWRMLCSNDLAKYVRGTPVIGGQMTLHVQGGPAGAPAALMFGGSNPNLALPFCTRLYSSAEVILPLPLSGTGAASFQLNVPNDPGLQGGTVWNQWWIIGPNGLLGTSGGRAIVGI